MKALGADITLLHSEGGKLTKELFFALKTTTEEFVRKTGAYWTNQFENSNQITGYHSLGREIWEQTNGKVDAFVHVVGTCGSFRGVASTLRQSNPRLYVVAVEPAESAVLSGGPAGAHRIEGVGLGRIPALWDSKLVNGIEKVSTEEAENMARRLAREEGLFVGTSSGANVVAALRIAEMFGPNATVATIMVDTGLKYLSTELFQ